MADLIKWQKEFVNDTSLEYMYVNHSQKFVEYIEFTGYADKSAQISGEQLKRSVKYYSEIGAIQTINSMNNHLNAIKKFFVYLKKQGKIKENFFDNIEDYDGLRQSIIAENDLKPANERGYFENEWIEQLLAYFNSKPQKYSNMTMMGFYFRINLLVPVKRKVLANLKVGDFSDNFDRIFINGFDIKLPRALTNDILDEMRMLNREIKKDSLFFELFCGCKYSENIFNTPFYYALKEIGYEVDKGKDTFSVECIRNTSIVNLIKNGVSLYWIAELSGLSLSGIDNLLKKFALDRYEKKAANELINKELCKFDFYYNI